MLTAARRGLEANAFVITSGWLKGFRQEYRISLRKPNQRWKVSRSVFVERIRILMLNFCRVRAIIYLLRGYWAQCDNFDQKPMYFNHGGAKLLSTLAPTGAKVVALREQTHQVHARWTANTLTQSDAATTGRIPHLELMFKGKSGIQKSLDTVEADLRASGIHFVTLTTSDSASYRLEHVLDWMDKALEPWSEGRELRLLLCDAYSAHDDEAVRRLAWSKGYIVLYVGGGPLARCRQTIRTCTVSWMSSIQNWSRCHCSTTES
jgi:hypothetical protein